MYMFLQCISPQLCSKMVEQLSILNVSPIYIRDTCMHVCWQMHTAYIYIHVHILMYMYNN